MLPAASRARAASVCEPLALEVLFQEAEYGDVVSSAPRLAPSSRNCTPATPTLSDALAVTATVPDTVAPEAGAVRVTLGGVVSAAPASALNATICITQAFEFCVAVALYEPVTDTLLS